MRYQLLGPSGRRVSELCLGTMSFGEAWGLTVAAAAGSVRGSQRTVTGQPDGEPSTHDPVVGNLDRRMIHPLYRARGPSTALSHEVIPAPLKSARIRW